MKTKQYLLTFSLLCSIALFGCGQSKQGSSSSDSSVQTNVIDKLRKSAEGGDAKAQFELAKRFDVGDEVEKNLTTAFEWFLKSAENGNVDAIVEVANHIIIGKGTQSNYEKSKPWLMRAAEAGNPSAQYRYAKFFGRTNDYTEILGEKNQKQENAQQYVEWLGKAAKQNHVAAKYSLGITYMLGTWEGQMDDRSEKLLIEPDIDKGLLFLRESADAGFWQAQRGMAALYQSGYKKIESNKSESDKYWRKFVEHTDPKVQRRIGTQYYKPNIYAQFTVSGPLHFISDKTGKTKYQGRELTHDESNKVAFEWFQKAAAQDDKESIYRLGVMYRDGTGTRKDLKNAMEFFERAAVMGHQASMLRLASALLEGEGIVKNYVEAHKWLLKVANLNHLAILEALVDFSAEYSEDNEVPNIDWARNALGVLYARGQGVEKDIVLAYAWYNIAASGGDKFAKNNLAGTEGLINPEELQEAQILSREWGPGKPLVRVGSGVSNISMIGEKSLKLATVGSGFYVSHDGNIVTNNHVIQGCSEIRVPVENAIAKLIVADQANDLALVKLDVTGKVSAELSSLDNLKQGEEVFVFGFPLDGYLPSTGNITPGIISALAGPGNNSSLVQITAPVQQGNSGGPLLNKKGKVVGVIVGKANAISIARVTGDIPQNINFAIAPRTVKSFLDGNRIAYQKKGDAFSFDKDSVAIADEGRKISLKIECWR